MVTIEIIAILALVLANGVFALSEIAVVSARQARLQRWAEEGDKRAAAALDLANHPDEFLATEQAGITLIGILAGFAMSQLGRVARAGDHFEWGGHRFAVVDMDRHLVDKVLVVASPPADEEQH